MFRAGAIVERYACDSCERVDMNDPVVVEAFLTCKRRISDLAPASHED